jgi:hypothetical protein
MGVVVFEAGQWEITERAKRLTFANIGKTDFFAEYPCFNVTNGAIADKEIKGVVACKIDHIISGNPLASVHIRNISIHYSVSAATAAL